MKQVWPPDVELEFTNRWSDGEREEMRERLLNVVSHFPEVHGQTIVVGRTKSKDGQFIREREHRHDGIYIRLKPGASRFTVAHEIYHHLTREKAVDIFALSRDEFLVDDAPSYVDLPQHVADHIHPYSTSLHRLAREAVTRFECRVEMVEWFEQEAAERFEQKVGDAS